MTALRRPPMLSLSTLRRRGVMILLSPVVRLAAAVTQAAETSLRTRRGACEASMQRAARTTRRPRCPSAALAAAPPPRQASSPPAGTSETTRKEISQEILRRRRGVGRAVDPFHRHAAPVRVQEAQINYSSCASGCVLFLTVRDRHVERKQPVAR